MKEKNNLAAQNQILISQLPKNLRHEYNVYCSIYSHKFQATFLAELEKLKDNPDLQYHFWDCFTNYTAHHVAGECAKKYTGNEKLDERLSFLYYAYDTDEEHVRRWTFEKEIDFLENTLRKHGVSCNLCKSLLSHIDWYRECNLHRGNYPVEKYLDYFDIDDTLKEKITNELKVKFFYDDLLIKELFKDKD